MPNLLVLKSDGSSREVTEAEWLAVVAGGGGSGSTAAEVQGNLADDVAETGNPVLVAGYASDTPPDDATANGRRRRFWVRRNGAVAHYDAYGRNPTDDASGQAPFKVSLNGSHTRNASLSSAVTLTPPAGAAYLTIQASIAGKNVRITFDGTTPTATVGFLLVAEDPPIRIPVLGRTFKVIEVSASADIQYQWENEFGDE